MARQVLIIHGWSDTSKSFIPLARFLSGHGYDIKLLWLGDYISLDDDVRVEDVSKRMTEVIDAMLDSGELQPSFDVIVHSTGGLVARSWLTTRYRGQVEKCPMKRLVMLAPANYGSKLAATGKSFLGRVVKGYDNWFQTGQAMLNDLELSSPFQWELAQRDILQPPGGDATRYYGEKAVWPFVIIGTHPYTSLLRRIVNEDGSDGTVRVCAGNLNAKGVTLDFTRPQNDPLIFQPWEPKVECDVPLAVLPTRTHGSIVDPDREDSDNKDDIAETDQEKDLLGALILEALSCPDFVTYRQIQQRWNDEITEPTAARRNNPPQGSDPNYYHQYLQVNAYVVDNHGKPVPDYMLEFFSNTSRRNDDANVYLLGKVLEDVKKNSLNEALRNLFFDRTDLVEGYYPLLPSKTDPTLFLSISAASPGKNVKYFERDKDGATQTVPVHLADNNPNGRWLKRNTTHFVQIIIPRQPGEGVFKLTNAQKVVG